MNDEQLAREIILDHYKHPRNQRELVNPTATSLQVNPLCGDEVAIQIVESEGILLEVAFLGKGCSVSQSSASMLTEAVLGRTRAEAAEVRAGLLGLLNGAPTGRDLGDLGALAGVARYPARVRCALLAWEALEEALVSRSDGR
jgi:nitrogen fixation NifU-like protein